MTYTFASKMAFSMCKNPSSRWMWIEGDSLRDCLMELADALLDEGRDYESDLVRSYCYLGDTKQSYLWVDYWGTVRVHLGNALQLATLLGLQGAAKSYHVNRNERVIIQFFRFSTDVEPLRCIDALDAIKLMIGSKKE